MSSGRNLTFLKANKTLWSCGVASDYGQNGDNTATNRSSPVSVVGNHRFTYFDASYYGCAALKCDGTIWCWGDAGYGSLGNNQNTPSRSSPVSVVGNHSFMRISGGYPKAGLKADGSMWCWGWGVQGQCGDNTTSSRSSPVSVVGNHSFVTMCISTDGGVGIKSDGTAWCWGGGAGGTYGCCGDNTTNNRSSPVSVVGNHLFIPGYPASSPVPVVAIVGVIARGDNMQVHCLKPDGTCWGWGANNVNQLGDGTSTHRSSPVSVVGNHRFVRLTSGQNSTYGLKSNGEVWGWGSNSIGQLGDNSASNRNSPVRAVGNHSFIGVFGTRDGCMAVKANGEVWAWGRNDNGELGDNTAGAAIPKSSPVLCIGVVDEIPHFTTLGGGSGIKSGNITSWGWGNNSSEMYGTIGDNTAIDRSSPVSVVGNHQFQCIRRDGAGQGVGVKGDGSCWCWGKNDVGQCGANTSLNNYSSPVSVVGAHIFKQVVPSDYDTLFKTGLKTDGTAWCWGANYAGDLGDNVTTANRSSPVSVVGGHIFTMIGCSCGIKASDGSAWSWGSVFRAPKNGDNTGNARSSPVSVVGNHSFIWIAGNIYNRFCLKSDGTCWSWGWNAIGQLGDNSISNRSSPVSVVGGHSFIKVYGQSRRANASYSHVIALKADGSAWCWGLNGGGQLGDMSITDRSSPVSVVGNHSFVDVSVFGYASCGIKNNGELWAWGDNTYGDLGTNNRTNRSSPVQVVGLFCS